MCLDEHLFDSFVPRLKRHGRHKVSPARYGVADVTVLRSADGILITRDRGFDDARRFPPGTHKGIVVIAVSGGDVKRWFSVFLRFLRSGHGSDAEGSIVVLHDRDFLIRTSDGTQTFRYE